MIRLEPPKCALLTAAHRFPISPRLSSSTASGAAEIAGNPRNTNLRTTSADVFTMAVRPFPAALGALDELATPRKVVAEPKKARGSRAVGAVGAVAIVGYFLLRGRTAHDLAYSAIGVAGTIAMLVATLRRPPAQRWGWLALIAANALFVLGDGVYDVYDLVLHRATPFPSLADALYLAGYPLLFTGVARISRLRSAAGAREARADAAMVSIGALALSWHLLMTPYAHDGTLSPFGKAVTLAYPILDVAVLFILVSSMMARTVRRPVDSCSPWRWRHAGRRFRLRPAGPALGVQRRQRGGRDVPAVLRPHGRSGRPPQRRPRRRRHERVARASGCPWWPSRVRVPGHRDAEQPDRCQADAGVLAGTSIALCRWQWCGRAGFRALRANTTDLREREQSLQEALATQQELEDDLRHQAFHDSLTGLANRALLHDRVEHALAASRRRGRHGRGVLLRPGRVQDGQRHAAAITSATSCWSSPASGCLGRRGPATPSPVSAVTSSRSCSRTSRTPTAATAVAERIVSVLREPIDARRRQVALSVSVGVAFAGAEHDRPSGC